MLRPTLPQPVSQAHEFKPRAWLQAVQHRGRGKASWGVWHFAVAYIFVSGGGQRRVYAWLRL